MEEGKRKEYNIHGRNYIFTRELKENEQIRRSFYQLARKVYGLDFEPWYENGYWGNNYIPYVLMEEDTVVANISVNIMSTRWQDQPKRYIQLGTVMTDENYRGRGLSRFLMEKILADWKDRCDSLYLFANNSVLEFYPKFGFERAPEYQCQKTILRREGQNSGNSMNQKARVTVKKLAMSQAKDRLLLQNLYRYSNPYSALPMEENEGLLMFYCSQFRKDNVYSIASCETIVIAEYEEAGEKLICYDIFGKGKCSLEEIIDFMAKENTKTVLLGFPPKQTFGFTIHEYCQEEEDTTLFLLQEKENLFRDNKLMFPLLSHA